MCIRNACSFDLYGKAQCCELERLRLVDGMVTDDSDAFAFGGRTVYKNIFNDRKYVEAYLLPDVEKVRVQSALVE